MKTKVVGAGGRCNCGFAYFNVVEDNIQQGFTFYIFLSSSHEIFKTRGVPAIQTLGGRGQMASYAMCMILPFLVMLKNRFIFLMKVSLVKISFSAKRIEVLTKKDENCHLYNSKNRFG